MENLGKLHYGYHEIRFLARIIKKWESFSFHTYCESMINFILVDEENGQYWDIAPSSERERLKQIVFPSMLYHIINFKIVVAQPSLKPLDTDRTIVFSKDTQWLDYVNRSSIPRFKFTLSSWPRLISRANSDSILSDICGVIVQVGDIEYQNNDLQKLNLTLIDNSLIKIHISLWEVKTTIFQRDFKEHRNKNVVLVITGLLVKEKKGNIYLSSTPATSLAFKSECQEVHNLAANISGSCGDFICRMPHEIEHHYQFLPKTNIIMPSLTIQQFLRIPLWIYQKFLCNVTITDILLQGRRHNRSCLACKGSVSMTENKYYCATCGRNFITPPSRPTFVLHVMDHTGRTKFTIQAPELKQLTGYSRKELLKDNKVVNGALTFPTALEIIKGAQCTFEIMLSPSSYSNKTGKLIIDNIIQYTKLR